MTCRRTRTYFAITRRLSACSEGCGSTPVFDRVFHPMVSFPTDAPQKRLGLDVDQTNPTAPGGNIVRDVQLYAFDILAMDGDDLRDLSLSMRRANLATATPPAGWHLPDQLRTGRDRPRSVSPCLHDGIGSLVSKRGDRPYRGGRSKDWIKVKKREHPAMERVMKAFL
jgi:bifunctional non-homologous end joining protein LigD